MNNETLRLMDRLIAYGEKYEITLQIWPNQITVYVAKGGVDLFDYGDYHLTHVLACAVDHLDRLNKK